MNIAASKDTENLYIATSLPIDLLQQAMGALSVGTILWRLDNPQDPGSLRLLYYNPAAERSAPVHWPDLLDRPIGEALPAFLESHLAKVYYELALSGGTTDVGDIQLNKITGDELFSVRAVGLADRCVLVTFTNVTTERGLMQDVERFFNNLRTPMGVVGLDGYYKRLNPAFLALLGHPEQELLATPWVTYVHPEDRELIEHEMMKLQAGLPTISYEARVRTATQEYRRLAWTITLYQNKLYGAAYDVTELRQIEAALRATTSELANTAAELRELAETRAELVSTLERNLSIIHQQQNALTRAEKLAAIGQLAASVGHELRNPLAAVRNATSYLSKQLRDPVRRATTGSDPRIAKFFEIIERELNMTGKIINDLLDFARERELAFQPCPLAPLVDEAISLVVTGNVQLKNRIPNTLPLPSIDREQIRQVLVNLAQNAVDAIPADRSGEVSFAASGGDRAPWQIVVQDNGSGIDAAVLGRIFEPLYTTKIKGTGLGLAIVQNIIKRHGGQIEVQSQLGLGTAITITLPGLTQPGAQEARSS